MATPLMVGVECTSTTVRAALVPLDDGSADRGRAGAAAHVSLDLPQGRTGRLRDVLRALVGKDGRAARARAVSIATTEFGDALRDGRDLARTACLRLVPGRSAAGHDAASAILADWPDHLRPSLAWAARTLPGGCHFDGRRTEVLDEEMLTALAGDLRAAGVGAVAVTGTFASVDPRVETDVAESLARLLPGVPVSVSHPLGSIGLLARENATVLNAAVRPWAERRVEGWQQEVAEVLPQAGSYLTRVDGTVMELRYAAVMPVLTLGAVTASRVRGAARSAGFAHCLVVLPGEGALRLVEVRDGEPLRSPQGLEVGGVRTSLADLDVVETDEGDLAGLRGRAGDRHDLPRVLLGDAVPGVEVAPLADRLVAGAIGAAGSMVAGTVDRIVASGRSHDPVLLEGAGRAACQQAVLAGAEERSVVVTEVTESPLAYVPGDLVRLRVTATGSVPGLASAGVHPAHQRPDR